MQRKKVKTIKSLSEKYLEEIFDVGLKPQLIEEGKLICQSMYDMIQKDSGLASVMAMYEDSDPPAFSHLFLVSFMAAITCRNLEWTSQRTVELIVFGAMLHDIGMLKLPQELRDLDIGDMSPKQLEMYKEHPRLGSELLQMYPIITEPVRQIVYQHHEYVNGEGFPNGFTGIKIYPLAKVVALADEFSYILRKHKVKPIEGLRILLEDRKNIVRFEPLIVKALIKGFIK